MLALLVAQAVRVGGRADGSAPLWYVAAMIAFGLLVIVIFAVKAAGAKDEPVRPRHTAAPLQRPSWRYLNGVADRPCPERPPAEAPVSSHEPQSTTCQYF